MSTIKDFVYSYIVGDSYGLGLLNNDSIIDKIMIQNNNSLNISSGSFSSMTTNMLCVIDAIKRNKEINIIDIINNMCLSLIVGKYTNDGKVYDIDNNTLNILKYYSTKNNLNYEYNLNDKSSYALSRIVPLILYNYKTIDDLDNFVSIISLTNHNEEVLFGAFIYYKYSLNILNGKDKYKALKIDIPNGFSNDIVKKYKKILKGYIFYNDIELNSDIINTLSIVFYVILNTDSFDDIFKMLNYIEGNTNIYGSLICGIGGLLYGFDSIDKSIIKSIKNKKDINKYIKNLERVLK